MPVFFRIYRNNLLAKPFLNDRFVNILSTPRALSVTQLQFACFLNTTKPHFLPVSHLPFFPPLPSFFLFSPLFPFLPLWPLAVLLPQHGPIHHYDTRHSVETVNELPCRLPSHKDHRFRFGQIRKGWHEQTLGTVSC